LLARLQTLEALVRLASYVLARSIVSAVQEKQPEKQKVRPAQLEKKTMAPPLEMPRPLPPHLRCCCFRRKRLPSWRTRWSRLSSFAAGCCSAATWTRALQ